MTKRPAHCSKEKLLRRRSLKSGLEAGVLPVGLEVKDVAAAGEQVEVTKPDAVMVQPCGSLFDSN